MRLERYKGREGKASFRLMTLSEAKALRYGDHIWFKTIFGDARRAKVNGEPKTWKRTPNKVRVSIKYGMYEYCQVDMVEDTMSPVQMLVEARA